MILSSSPLLQPTWNTRCVQYYKGMGGPSLLDSAKGVNCQTIMPPMKVKSARLELTNTAISVKLVMQGTQNLLRESPEKINQWLRFILIYEIQASKWISIWLLFSEYFRGKFSGVNFKASFLYSSSTINLYVRPPNFF